MKKETVAKNAGSKDKSSNMSEPAPQGSSKKSELSAKEKKMAQENKIRKPR